jgi:hypothetical protein
VRKRLNNTCILRYGEKGRKKRVRGSGQRAVLADHDCGTTKDVAVVGMDWLPIRLLLDVWCQRQSATGRGLPRQE